MTEAERTRGLVTQLLGQWRGGDEQALERLTPMVYDELRRVAARCLRRERTGHTLPPTALVHEAYIQLMGGSVDCRDRSHFLAMAGRLMRQILVQHARKRKAAKRGGNGVRLEMSETITAVAGKAPEILAVDEALDALASVDGAKSRLVESRYFGGLTNEEIAEAEGLSLRSVERHLQLAQAWMNRYLSSKA